MSEQTLEELFAPGTEFLPDTGSEDLDIGKMGHFGFSPNHAGWASEKAYVKQNFILMLLEAPKFMSLMDNSDRWYAALRAFVETLPTSVTGFEAGLTVNVVDHAAGASGEAQQDFTKVTRERSNPVFNFATDRSQNVIQKMIATWITYGMSDPATNIPLAITLPNYTKTSGTGRNHWLAPWYSMTFIAMEPNSTMTKVINSWLVTNSWPMGTGPISGQRDIASDLVVPELSFSFTAFSDFNGGINRYAESLLAGIKFETANPNTQVPFVNYGADLVSPEVKTATGVGYAAGVEKVRDNQL